MSRTTDVPIPPREQDESFLRRFSRLKQEARPPADSQTDALVDAGTVARPESQAQALADQPAPLTDADMPDIETLDAESDYTGFLSAKVSESLRRAALRKLFHSSAFNVIDELDDYNEDFTTFQALGDLVTAEMKHRELLEQQRAQAAEAEAMQDPAAQLADDPAPGDCADTATHAPRSTSTVAAEDGQATEITDKPDEREHDEPATPHV